MSGGTKPGVKTKNQSLFQNLRALPRPAWILFFGTFLNKFGGFVVPFLTLYLTGQGYTIVHAGLAIGAYGVGTLVASWLGGWLADMLGRRKTIVFSMFSGAVTMILLSQAKGLPAIVILTALTGLANEFYRPASSALLADLVPPEQRVTAFAAYRLAFNAGFALGPAFAGFLASRGFFWLFAGDAATSVLFGLVALFALPVTTGKSAKKAGWKEVTHAFVINRRLQQALVASFAVAFVFFQLSSSFGLHVANLGFSMVTYGSIISLNGLLVVLFEMPITAYTRRAPERYAIAVGYLLIGIGAAMYAFIHTVAMLAVAMTIFTVGEMIAMPVCAAYIANIAPPDMRGRFMGIYGSAWAMALIVAPGVGMKMLAYSPSFLWLFCGALGVMAAVIIMVKIPERKTTASETASID
jgi:MFS family permease